MDGKLKSEKWTYPHGSQPKCPASAAFCLTELPRIVTCKSNIGDKCYALSDDVYLPAPAKQGSGNE